MRATSFGACRSFALFSILLGTCAAGCTDGRISNSLAGDEPAVRVDEAPSGTSDRRLAALKEASGVRDDARISISFHTAAVADPEAGTVTVFVEDGDVWREEARLSPSAPAKGFGRSVHAWGNTVLVGAPEAGANGAGAVFVFFRDWTGFVEQAVLAPEDGAGGDRFGASVALSGDTAVVGAPGADPLGESSGAAYVFKRSRRVWRPAERLVPMVAAEGSAFGSAVSVKGHSALVREGDELGFVHRFERAAGAWLESGTSSGKGASSLEKPSSPASSHNAGCDEATTLNALVTCIRTQMPRSGSESFVPLTGTQRTAMRKAVQRMMNGECDFALPSSINWAMQVRTFTDDDTGDYCLLMEDNDDDEDGYVDQGWGTFIVRPDASRQIVHSAAHPISDSGTELEAVDVFKETDSRGYLLCGAHRNANAASSSCQSSYRQADCAHETRNLFFQATQAINDYYGATPYASLQWHGMAVDTCPGVDVFLGEGLLTAPKAISHIPELRDDTHAMHPSWNVDTTGDGTCNLNATDNVEGRLLNGIPVSSVCTTEPTTSTGKFISIEQKIDFRNASDWLEPVEATFPAP